MRGRRRYARGYTEGRGEEDPPAGQVRTDAFAPGAVTQTDFGYTGQWDVTDLGLMDYKARFYDPALGRFTQPDSIIPNAADPQSWDRYSYVVNNPLRFTDPSGRSSCVGGHWDDGPECAKKEGSQLNIQIKIRKYQNECAAGRKQGCEGGSAGMIAYFALGVLTAGSVEYSLLGGAAYNSAEAGFWKVAQSCIGSAVCRLLSGMAGGAGLTSSGQGFSSFRALEAFLGDAGDGMEWHHIVEQSQIGRSGFPVEQVQNTSNTIAVEETIHDQISGFYNSNIAGPGTGRVRDWLAGQSFEAQYGFGLQVLQKFGVTP